MAFPFRSLFSLSGKKLSEEQKLQRILASAVKQRVELHVVFGQRLVRPVPVRGRFGRLDQDRILISLDISAVFDAWLNEPCSVYFSVRCEELSGSYAFNTRMLAHETRDSITRAFIATPESYASRQVRRFERLAPGSGMVQRMAVWNLKENRQPPLNIPALSVRGNSPKPQPQSQLQVKSRLSEGPPLVSRLPAALQEMGPADFLQLEHKKACELVNVSAGGARMRLLPQLLPIHQTNMSPYEEGDNILLLLALSRPRSAPLLLSLAGVCCGLSASEYEHDLKMRFLYWNHTDMSTSMSWAPVTLRGVAPLFEWVSQELGIGEAPKGVETAFDTAHVTSE